MVKIAKRFTFDAAHQLFGLPDGHKCKRLHGHTYRVELQLRGPVDANGFVVDYAEIAAAWAGVDAQLDHQYLNNIPGLEVPSTEVLAAWIAERLLPLLPELCMVRVSESSSTWAEVEVQDEKEVTRSVRLARAVIALAEERERRESADRPRLALPSGDE